MQNTIDRLRDKHTLTADEYKQLLSCADADEYLHEEARRVALRSFGNKIFIRGLIEISNHCRNNCLYCGIRRDNGRVARYRLDKRAVIDCCSRGYALGFRTFVLQGGEDPVQSDEWVEDVTGSIHAKFPDCAITLSLGERSREAYARFRRAGADRYLLRHETFDADHYRSLHPAEMSRDHRLHCLLWLKAMGYQTGTGMMIGSRGQTIDNLVDDILFIQRLRPQMIGMGPFIPHHDTPLANEPPGSMAMTLKLISIFRLINPRVLIPATTALSTLMKNGHQAGIMAGANVVMPNLSPVEDRSKYALYDNKAFQNSEAAEGLQLLRDELKTIGYEIEVGRGDYGDL